VADDPDEGESAVKRRQAEFDRRYRLLELKERRADREAKLHEVEITKELKEKELRTNGGRGIRFTSSQATVAAAAIALLSAVTGGAMQGFFARDVEAGKNQALIAVESLKADANIALEKQKQEAAEQLDRAKFETTLILKATEAPKREDAIRNLKFFLTAGFIHDPSGKIAKIDDAAYPTWSPTPVDLLRGSRRSVGHFWIPATSSDEFPTEGVCFIVSKDGYALTAAHLVQSAASTPISVTLGSSFDAPRLPARVIKIDEKSDLAVIKFEDKLDYYSPLRISHQPVFFEDPITVMAYSAYDIVVIMGTVLSTNESDILISVVAAAGSPVLNKNGEVVAVMWGEHKDKHHTALATQIGRAGKVLAEIPGVDR
jgi:Trypsin-like peptidase domain